MDSKPGLPISLARRRALALLIAAAPALGLAGVAGCRKEAATPTGAGEVPKVTVVRPQRGCLRWTVRQPGSIEAYEEAPIIPKIAGYIERWDVDIGDRVKKGQELAKLWVPDLVAQLQRRKAEVEQTRRMLEVAGAHVGSAAAAVEEARAVVSQARASLAYRSVQFGRVNQLLNRSAISAEAGDESTCQLRAAEAFVKEAEAKVARTEADCRESEAVRDKARVDIAVAEAALAETQAMVGYATLTAPFDGVVTMRRTNTGDFVQPPTGGTRDPLYVIQRRDVVRIFVDVPEADATWVKEGTPARIEIPTRRDRAYAGAVQRISYALKRQTRTLLAEIDFPNPDDALRPGMYVAATLQVERLDMLILPAGAVASEGSVNEGYRDYCYLLEGGKLRRMRIEVGARGEDRVQVLRKEIDGGWIEFSGGEEIVVGDIAALGDGQEFSVNRHDRTPAASAP